MNEEIYLTLSNVKIETFSRKNGRTGQKVIFLDDKLYRHEIDCVDKEEFDFTRFDGQKSITLVCECRNQKVTVNFGNVSRNTYLLVFTAWSVK